jgi:hypothetical protein
VGTEGKGLDLAQVESRLQSACGSFLEHYWLTRLMELRHLTLSEQQRLEELRRPRHPKRGRLP